ncbi:MAG: type IV secretory system conjugative DNA transfer family protein, partial [Candidatus Nomurabacteria bacterium]|nr:type IV secretory system conjugative DNA transfer family protein [Candidatus Nomurabacteria bacterium]
MGGVLITFFVVVVVGMIVAIFVWSQYSRSARESKNYERGLKMVPMLIHIPPSSDDIEGSNRDERDITDEVLSQAQVMYNIISSTATKGFKSKIHGQRHVSFEILSSGGLIHYYVVAPVVLVDIIRQAVSAAYPSARLEEIEEHNIFSQQGKLSGTIGGEFSLKKDYVYPLATYRETKQDASRALLNALSAASKEDGAVIQVMLRPANENWIKTATERVEKIKSGKKSNGIGLPGGAFLSDLAEILWKPPESRENKPEDKSLTNLEQAEIEAIEGKTKYPGYETLIRVIVSSSTASRSQALLQNIISSFSLFDSPSYNGFQFDMARDIDKLTTDYVLRFFPQTSNSSVLNSVELASIFHLPDQRSIPTSQIKRQMAKQVDGPTETMDQGLLLGYNEFRGVKKPIRLSDKDRRRHTYVIGGTGMGKSVLLKNLAYQDMMDGRGFAFVDPHGDAVEDLLGMVPPERVDDIVYFNPSDLESPVGLNLFEFDTQDQKDFLIQEAIAMLYKLYDPGHTGIIGPRYEHWFRNAALTIMSDPNGSTFIDVPQVFNDQGFTNEKLKYVKDQTVLDFWYKEMAQTSEANKSEVLGWFVSKFGAFLSNEMMRNILGQTKSGFSLREIMDSGKILLVNLSKGTTGEINSQLLGMIFVMKFQAAAMGRANIPEDQRRDFCLYVDEFQNFATDSFESILSEARKYRLNLIVVNQFMTQLTDKIREAIIGNVGTMVAGRVGVTDAEVLQKKFMPTFDAEDLTKLPNFQAIASVMINDVPSSPFSMRLIPQMGKTNESLRDSLKQYSAVKYGRPRHEVDIEIKKRLGAGDEAKRKQQEDKLQKMQAPRAAGQLSQPAPGAAGAAKSTNTVSFLDSWIEKKHQLQSAVQSAPPATTDR